MSATTTRLGSSFATDFPELAVPWQAETAPDPQLLLLNEPLAAGLGLDPDALRTPEGVRFLVGNAVPPDARPVAQAYAGHQFGNYSPRLGDGRALLLGELAGADGHVRDLHLKGSGRTPLARGGDGLAAVGPMLREYVVSEAMAALGVPTTRALAVVATGAVVQRETPLPGAVLARVAASHLRVGTFQYAAALRDEGLLRRLADLAIARHYPHLAGADEPYLALLRAVVAAQAGLVARWTALGFVHGVMNTDNMTISGETIDYGPCAFLDDYDPEAVFSSIDGLGRYAYENQPAAAQWNLARFAETLLPLLHADQDRAIALATEVVTGFADRYAEARSAAFAAKLGLATPDDHLLADLLRLLAADHVDWTSFFAELGSGTERDRFLDLAGIDAWLARWHALSPDPGLLAATNPVYVPRNHLIEPALTAASDGDLAPVRRLLDAVREPFSRRPGLEPYAAAAPADFGRYRTFCGT